MHLCEFIEDCEYSNLAVRILHLLGSEGPKTSKPSKYIRYIYNRVVLENAIVRAAAVTALAKFGAGTNVDANTKASIKVLLTRCLDDPEDEVRDRAALNLKLLGNEAAEAKFIRNGMIRPSIVHVLTIDSIYSLPVLEHKLVLYISSEDYSKPFDLSDIPIITKEQADAQALRALHEIAPAPAATAKQPKAAAQPTSASIELASQKYAKALSEIPEFKEFGAVLKSSLKPEELTEKETEYAVTAVKHIFKEHIVLQVPLSESLTNT